MFPFPPDCAEGIGEGAEEGADEDGDPRGEEKIFHLLRIVKACGRESRVLFILGARLGGDPRGGGGEGGGWFLHHRGHY